MRPGGVPILLLILGILVTRTANAEDLYWDEDDGEDFLQVKQEDSGIGHHIRRIRDLNFFNFFSSPSSTEAPVENYEIDTEDPVDDTIVDSKDDELDNDGSGLPDKVEQEPREKTLRVTFVVMEPYQNGYSNRDSVEFQNFSRSLAESVNQLFESLPGTQRASLVRIQSRLSDEFSCKVTLDIVTTGFEDTDRITNILRDHIHTRRELGSVTVNDADFSATVIDPGSTLNTCVDDEIQCTDGQCVPGSARCDGYSNCNDGSDEAGCPPSADFWSSSKQQQSIPQLNENEGQASCAEPIACSSSSVTYCPSQKCDGAEECPFGDDEQNCPPAFPAENNPDQSPDHTTSRLDDTERELITTTAAPPSDTCPSGEMRCDETRCVSLKSRCDGFADCYDGTDEANCLESCGYDDFRCDDGKCIPANNRCDHVVDCPNEEDEKECACAESEFRCISDGSCIEIRKRCDGVNHCQDKSDEDDCACGSDQWQCDHGNCIKRSKRCDGRVDCPSDRSDERNCIATGYFKCRTGKIIPESLRCNRRYDCPRGDYSDEKNCPCGEGDFKCDNGHCIPATKHCDRTHDCQDGSDERHCTYGTTCMAFQYKCSSGECVQAESWCNGTAECGDGSDERNCPCKRDQFSCRDGSCINVALRCNGHRDCRNGEDEFNCGTPGCPADKFECNPGSAVTCANRCDGLPECSTAEDEDNCPECSLECDGRCIEDYKICDNHQDCSDGSDEYPCNNCDGPDDFRCKTGGECIRRDQQCNNVYECPDYSDEEGCNATMISHSVECLDNQFRCADGSACIDKQFYCDGPPDCIDNSDEKDCQCPDDKFKCASGQCIPGSYYCDAKEDCADGSDEVNCGEAPNEPSTEYPYASENDPDRYPGGPSENDPSRYPGGQSGNYPNRYPGGTSGNDPNRYPGGPSGSYPNRYSGGSSGNDPTRYPGGPSGYDPSRYPGGSSGNDPNRYPGGPSAYNPSRYPGGPSGNDPNRYPGGQSGSDPNSYPSGQSGSDTNRYPGQPSGGDPNRYPGQPSGGDPNRYPGQPSGGDPNRNPGQPSGGDPNRYPGQPSGGDPNRYPGQPSGGDPNRNPGQPSGGDPNRYRGQPSGGDPNRYPGQPSGGDPNRYPGQPSGSNSNRYSGGPTGSDPNSYPGGQSGSDPNGYPGGESGSDPNSYPGGPSESDPSRYPGGPSESDPSRYPGGPSESDPNGYPRGQSEGESNYPYGQEGEGQPDGTSGGETYPSGSGSSSPDGNGGNGCSDPNEFQCSSGECIPKVYYCDGRDDCVDRSDENNCNNRPQSPTDYPYYTTESNQIYPDQPVDARGSSGSESNGQSGTGSNGYPYGQKESSSGSTDSQSGGTQERGYPYGSGTSSGSGSSGAESAGSRGPYGGVCNKYQWRCENGPCIDARRRCDGHIDCPFDFSDEFDCPVGSPVALNVKTYPEAQTIRYASAGGDVVFRCRDEGPERAPVRWVREGGGPLKPGSIDRNGRLEMYAVSVQDGGVYICQTPKYLRYPGSEVKVTLVVAPLHVTASPPFTACKSYEATCGNGQCIPKSAICNGAIDCNDGSDEEACNSKGMCEPNEFQCANSKCILKTWICDADNDCGDMSDEQNCGPTPSPGQGCLPVEFACASGDQCVLKSFHCDGQSDCFDKSDEIGCDTIYVSVPPTPSNLKLNPGDSMTLTCKAVGVPTPLISWRLNWGHVPDKCTATSVDGVGKLFCPNMQSGDSGAYSCEAINNRRTLFAAPDSIVYVNKTVCPAGYFNSEARSPSECIRCFCFGESTQCQSADLFTYNMPTPLGEGGTRLVGVKQTPSGDVQLDDSNSIADQYYYLPLRNGATVTKLETYTSNWSWSTTHPYLTLPETYNGNQLTSYGGHIKFTVKPHSLRPGPSDNMPTVIIKGKYSQLVHINNNLDDKDIYIEARLTPEYWQKPTESGLIPASREDIMMALDNVEMILLRADLNNAGVNISDFAMESAQHINVGLGAASLVEECTCPPGYEGLSCQKCASGYVRESAGPWLGRCVRPSCPPGTFGDPASGYDCKPCPCPLTNRENQFSRTCSLGPDGSVICDCFPGYEGRTCEHCAPGYVGNPLLPGDSCRPAPSDNCNKVGTSQVRLLDDCVCKDNVQGRYCDQCKDDSFFLSPDFRQGCAQCFCSGVSQQCRSSNLRRKTTTVQFNVPNIVDQMKVYRSALSGPAGAARYNAPQETELRPAINRGRISLDDYDQSQPSIYYWSLPSSFSGDKVTSYGGYLRYVLENVPQGYGSGNNAADVQLLSDNHLTFNYNGDFTPSSDGTLNATVQFLEGGWRRSDGKEVTREYFLMALSDVKSILIKASYAQNAPLATPLMASIETAEAGGSGPSAMHVEMCVCPAGYVGTSCEDCAPGYSRTLSGLYLYHCAPCECNGHANMCHPETGVCYDCADNTYGEHCQDCKPGFERDAYGNCVPSYPYSTTFQPCRCDPRGEETPCDASGQCRCKVNVEGESCDHCRSGTFGLDANNPEGCLACYCSGVTNECHQASHYSRIPLPAPIFGDNYGGYTLMDLNAEQVISDQFVPVPDQSELMYNFPFPSNTELFWSLPVFPGNRVLSYGGALSLRQEFRSNGGSTVSEPGTDVVLVGDDVSLYWTNPNPLRSGESMSYQVPLKENGWFILNSGTPASRNAFMGVLKNLRRVLVRATVTEDILSTSIADVAMDTAAESYDTSLPSASSVEICMCPNGYTGTSCETCSVGFYKDRTYCIQCPCNGNDCQLDAYGQVQCNCRPPYTGPDCSTIGLVMELHPSIRDGPGNSSLLRRVSFTCKYRAPEPLTIKFYHEGQEMKPLKYFNESTLQKDGWHGEHVWHTVWDTRHQGEIFECHTLTEKGFTLGVLTTSLPESAGEPPVTESPNRPPPPTTTVTVTIAKPTIKIQNVGSSVNFTCEAQSRISRNPLPIKWSKVDGYLPRDRSQTYNGILFITNLQMTDSGQYVCQTTDGVNTVQATATLKVPGNEMSMPTVSINPPVNDYYEGDRIELECIVKGNPTPTITWQRSSRRPLPVSVDTSESRLIIEDAREEDSGEYRCIGTNTLGTVDRTAMVNIRSRPVWPPRGQLSVQPMEPSVAEGQSTRVVCTGTADVPAGSIEWSRQDGGELLENVRSDNGVLYIEYATMDNQGVYVCQSSSVEISPIQVLLSVMPVGTPPPSEAPKVIVSIDHLKIPTGGSKTIECTPEGYPRPYIRWSKHEGTFGPSTSQRDNSLIISNAQDSDYGYYICDGNDADGAVVAKVYVYVEIEKREPPQVEIWPKGEQAVALGSQYQLDCRVLGGVPDPDVTWARAGGRPLSSSTQIQPHNILRFDRVEVNDEGEYTCSATNVAGTASASSVIKVHSQPEITILPAPFLSPVRGDSITVECRANGYPQPTVSIKSNRDHREIVPPSVGIAVLRIPSVSERDDDVYTCTATSPAGTREENIRIQVDRGDGGFVGFDEGSGDDDIGVGYPTNPEEPSNLLGYEGQPEIVLYCNVSNGFTPRWDRGDRQSLQRNAVQIDSRLIIFNASKSDSGQYVCSLEDRNTGEITGAAYTTLVIMSSPKITLRPEKQVVAPGDSPVVECVVEGDDILDISWRPLDRPLSRRVEARGTTLVFNQIQVEDAGHYECFARTRLQNASATAEVIVSEASSRTTSESHENEQYAHMGAAVHLSCNVSQPNLRIHWTKDGRPIPRSLRQNNDGSLYIRFAQKSDSGLYRCHVQDQYGRQTSNYINLHIQGIECLDKEFRCYDDGGCIDEDLLCDGFQDCKDNSDEENCLIRYRRFMEGVSESDPFTSRAENRRQSAPSMVAIEKPRSPFSVGNNVDVLCRVRSREVTARWEKYGTSEYVDYTTYGDGARLQIQGVQEPDAGVYRCIGTEPNGRTSYDNFTLEVQPGSYPVAYPKNTGVPVAEYTARLRDSINLPCNHNLEQPVYIEWKRDFTPLPSELSINQPTLQLDRVTEKDAGIYTCRVSNSRVTEEARAILRVTGVVPQFGGDSWLSLPTIKDAYRQLDIEVSFRPLDGDGLILYNSQSQGRTGDFLALQLINGVPQFELDTGTGPIEVRGDRPLQLNVWHTIRISRTESKVTMNVDNSGIFPVESSEPWAILDLYQPLYVGGVPDTNQLPTQLAGASGFIGCVSMLILGRKEQNLMMDSLDRYQLRECDPCASNECLNGAVCQEERNERGYMCLCAAGFAGENCDRTGEACRADLCGPGKCRDTSDGYKCDCPATHYGKNCEVKQYIEYPAYTGSAYSAIKPPGTSRFLKMSMKVKAMTPVTDGLIMYCAEVPRGFGGFTSLAVHDGHLEFRYDLGDGSTPVVLVSNVTLEADVWTDIDIGRAAGRVWLRINRIHNFEQKFDSPSKGLSLGTLMFVGGVDDSITLNNNTGVTGGFSGCIRDVTLNKEAVNIVTSSVQSVNVRDCSIYGSRGDIPGAPDPCSLCRNNGFCAPNAEVCTCPAGFTGTTCEYSVPQQVRRADPCDAHPCRHGGTCRPDPSSRMNHTCDCPLGFAGASCQMRLELTQSVGFNGNGYLELPARLLRYDRLDKEPAVIALAVHTSGDGVLLYQREALAAPGSGDYILLRVERGHVVLDWDFGSGISTLAIENVYVNDGERHQIITTLSEDQQMSLSVDSSSKNGFTTGISNVMNADSNVYIGGIPDRINVHRYAGLTGCLEQVELMNVGRGLNLDQVAVTGRNTQRCKESNRV